MIEEIKKKVQIKNLVRELGIKTFGNDFIKSIYKDEKNPSMKLYPKTNSFYDFSTGRGGDVLTFYADFRKIDVKQAVKELAQSAGIEKIEIYPAKEKEKTEETKPFYSYRLTRSEEEYFDEIAGVIQYSEDCSIQSAEQIAMKMILVDRINTQKFIYEELEKHCNGIDEESFNYLTGPKRGLNPEIIKMFRLFYIKDVKETIKFLQESFPPDYLKISGLFNDKGKFVFSYNRLIIPYLRNAAIEYLRGRKIEVGDERFKYIGLCNYAENLKARRFFNESILASLPEGNDLIVCEGEFDTIRAVQEGLPAIGIPGVNNFPTRQADLIRKYNLYLAFDNDLPGLKAMNEVTEKIGKATTAIILKNHKDITEFLNERK